MLGGQAPVTKSTAMTGGDLSGMLPAPTVQTVLGGKAPIYAGQTGANIKHAVRIEGRRIGWDHVVQRQRRSQRQGLRREG